MENILWDHAIAPCVEKDEDGFCTIDFEKFHDVRPAPHDCHDAGYDFLSLFHISPLHYYYILTVPLLLQVCAELRLIHSNSNTLSSMKFELEIEPPLMMRTRTVIIWLG